MNPADAAAAITFFAVAPLGAGIVLKGAPCPARDAILDSFAAIEPALRLRRVPIHISGDRLSGGIDIAASIAAGRPVEASGLLSGAPFLCALTMAERWDGGRAALIAESVDSRRIGLIALDEGQGDEMLAGSLADRCALRVALEALPDDFAAVLDAAAIGEARRALPDVTVGDDMLAALCGAAAALGVAGMRAVLAAAFIARIAAALEGRRAVAAEDAAVAARLVLSPRATRLPPAEQEQEPPPPEQAEEQESQDPAPPEEPNHDQPGPDQPAEDAGDDGAQGSLDDLVLEATRVALPANLLSAAEAGRRSGARNAARNAGRHGDFGAAKAKGRPIGSRPGMPGNGLRLDLIGTLRAAAPWQRLRGRTDPSQALRVTRSDLRIVRCRPRTATTTIFAVDASGSLALARLAEAKGAVELLLAECYVRRDSVALVAFRGPQAEVLLPPTRAPARARRCLSGLAGGGGTPLAAGILAASELADAAVRRGETPTIVLLTDGQANITRAGTPGRPVAQQEALEAARALRLRGHRAVLIDTAPRRQPAAQSLAEAMGGRYLALPRADAQALNDAVRAAQA